MIPIVLIPKPASAMGPPPNGCANIYAGTITSLIVTYPVPGGTNTYNAVAHPNQTISLPGTSRYNLTLTIQAAYESNSSNKMPGSVWYHEDADILDGVCVGGY